MSFLGGTIGTLRRSSCRHVVLWAAGWTVVLAAAVPAGACKYSVRDVAFADTTGAGYRVELYARGDGDRTIVDTFERVAPAVLADSNVVPQTVIVGGDAAPLEQLRAVSLSIEQLPAVVLRDESQRALLLAGPTQLGGDEQSLWSILESVVDSPLRREILDSALSHHSVILVIEGTDAGLAQRAYEMADGASARIGESLTSLPKPIQHPPRRTALERGHVDGERVLLWSLGAEQPDDPAESHVVLFFGRGRRLGPVLTARDATQAELVRRLWYVGQDCECELDRSWLTGPMVPHRWDTQRQTQAARELGFDPGNPLVVSEIRRILARGSRSARSNSAPGLAGADPLLGYAELPVEMIAGADSIPDSQVSTDSQPSAAAGDRPPGAGTAALGKGPPSTGERIVSGAGTRPRNELPVDSAERPEMSLAASGSPVAWLLAGVLVALLAVAIVGGGVIWLRAGREV